MSRRTAGPDRRAERLLRWYPKEWRARYGEEFVELLAAELSERPRSWPRDLDVATSGLVARVAAAGLGGKPLEPCEQVRRSLATQACAMAVFLVVGLSIWAQLAVGWQWSQPATVGTSVAMVVMFGAVLGFLALGVLAAVPIAWNLLRRSTRQGSRDLVVPALLLVASITVIVVGGRHFGNGWPGTGGHPWAHQGLVPGGMAAFAWAITLGVSSYWAHPHALLSFPAVEVAWMAISPLATACLVVGTAKLFRRLEMSKAVLRYEAQLARLATVTMILFLAGAGSWVFEGGPGPRDLFHVGIIDVVGVAAMAVALAVSGRAAQLAGRGRLAIASG